MNQQPDIAQAKQAWRTEIRAQRQGLSTSEKLQLDTALVSNLATFLAQNFPAKSIAAYLPLPSEPGGLALHDFCADYPYALWLPQTQPDHQLLWGRMDESQFLAPGNFGILEPQHHLVDFQQTQVDLLLLPGLGVSLEGRRIGQGGGFYDRLLASTNIARILLTYSWEISPKVPFAAHDCRVDVAISERGVTQF